MVWGGGREVWMGKGLAKQERDWEKTRWRGGVSVVPERMFEEPEWGTLTVSMLEG